MKIVHVAECADLMAEKNHQLLDIYHALSQHHLNDIFTRTP
ncbi:hypothetical protein VAE308_1051497 [Vibrio aestuarianus]|nr:hypothetical protein VAE308_1051497 [Vibrio aestuarianus]